MDRDSRIRKIIFDLADAAYSAADAASDAVQNASQVVGEKYDVLRLNVEISRLQSEQDKLFAGIGHTLYMIQTGELKPAAEEESAEGENEAAGETIDAQQTIDRLLLLADQKQQEIDAAKEKLRAVNGGDTCARCGKNTEPGATYCSACGSRVRG